MTISGTTSRTSTSAYVGTSRTRQAEETPGGRVTDASTATPGGDTRRKELQDGFSASMSPGAERLGASTGGAVGGGRTVPAHALHALLAQGRPQPAAALSMAPVPLPGLPPPPKGVSFPFRVDLKAFINKNGRNPTPEQLSAEFKAQFERRHPGSTAQGWVGAAPRQEDIDKLIKDGSIVITVVDNTLKPPGAKEKAETDTYLQGLGAADKEWLAGEADRQYAEKSQSGTKPTSPEEKAYRDALKQELVRRHQGVEALPPHLREFLLKDTSGMPWDEEAARRIGKKLAGFSPEDLADYLSKVTGHTTDWGKLEQSLDAYRSRRAERTEGAQRLEDLKTRLHTPVELYSLYKEYLDLSAKVNRANHGAPEFQEKLRRAEQTLKEQLPTYGFADIPAFRDAISDFKASYEKQTLELGLDTLREYESVLFKAERRYEDTSGLHFDLRQARQLLAQATQLDLAAQRLERPYNPKLGPPPMGDAKALRKEEAKVRTQARELLTELVAKHPVLMDGKFAAELARAPENQLQGMLRAHAAERRKNIETTREALQKNPRLVYELDNLLKASNTAHRIQPGSLHAAILKDHQDELQRQKLELGLMTTAVCVGAGLLSAGGGSVATVAALGAFALGAYEAKQALQQYVLERAANGAQLLSTEPGFGWVVLAVTGAAFDLGAAAKSLKALHAMKNAVREFNGSHDLIRLELKLKALPEVTPQMQKRVLDAARDEVQQRQHLEGLRARGGALQVGAAPDARLGELTQVARSLAERGDESFDTFLKELRDSKLLQGEPSPQSLQRLKEVYSEGVQQARQARKAATALVEKEVAEKLEAPRQTPVTKQPVTPKTVQRPTEPVRIDAPRANVESAMNKVARLRKQFSNDELSRAAFNDGVMQAFQQAGGDPKVAFALRRLRDKDESMFRDAFATAPPGLILRMASSKDPLRVDYAERLIQNATELRMTAGELTRALNDAERLAKLPSPAKVKDVRNSSGGVGTFYVGTFEGKPMRFKTVDAKDVRTQLETEEAVLKGLAPYGAPEYRGRFRVQDPDTGLWHEAVGMKDIDGVDLKRLMALKEAGAPLPFPITERHMKALQAFEEQLRADGKHVTEVQLNDFILTNDPNRPLVPVDMYVTPGTTPASGLDIVPVHGSVQSLIGYGSKP